MSSTDKLTIETPEQTLLDFPLAGIGSRFLALAADLAVQAVAAAISLLVGMMLIGPVRWLGSVAPQWILASLVFGGFLLNSGYFAFFESIWNGQTPGKRYARIRVMKDDGRPVSVYDAIARNLLRIVDAMPGPYAVGMLSILFSKQNKRLGDYVAGTVVVHERTIEGSRPYLETHVDPAAPVYDMARLSIDEFHLIEAFFSRCDSLEPAVRTAMSAQIATRIGNKLGVAVRGWPQTENFLAAIVRQYRATGRFRSQ
jgi:uncharacterized RDD family membrane protein YckC